MDKQNDLWYVVKVDVGRDNALNVDTTREQIYPHSTREQIDRFTIRLHHSSAPNN